MTEKNPAWLPIVRIEPDPIERALSIIWLYEICPPRIQRSQRYSLALTELPSPRDPTC